MKGIAQPRPFLMALSAMLGLGILAPDAIRAQLTCAEAGYLCTAPADRPAVRWPEGRRALRILVPPPPHEPSSRALWYQRSATRGIMAWNRLPLELQVFEQAGNLKMDIVVEWVDQLPETRIGETQVTWSDEGDEYVFDVVRFVLATRPPESFYAEEEGAEGDSADAGEATDSVPDEAAEVPDQLALAVVELTAAHEMGHALGLPHSDSTNDVMYPENMGAGLSRRDIQTVRALYALPPCVKPAR